VFHGDSYLVASIVIGYMKCFARVRIYVFTGASSIGCIS